MNTKDIVYISLFAAIMAALGIFPPLTIPAIGIPITAQSMGVMLAGGILGAKRGGLSLVLFMILVAIGLPLLAGGRGGLGVFAGPTAGFLLGYVVGAFCVGWLVEKFWYKLNIAYVGISCVLGGIVAIYALGIPWLAYSAAIPLEKAFLGSMAFVPGDAIKAIIATAIIIGVKRAYPLISR